MRITYRMKILLIFIVICFIFVFIINTEKSNYMIAETDMIVLEENRVVAAIPEGKVYIENSEYTYHRLFFDTTRNDSLFKRDLMRLIDDESKNGYLLPGKFLENIKAIEEFPLYYVIVDDGQIIINLKATRENEYYQMYKKTYGIDNIISRVSMILKLSKNEEFFKDYIGHVGINVKEDIINIMGIEFEYDFNSRTLYIKNNNF